jgi:multidrug efflux pump subunit AcrA (membrane-fusion protein)
VHILNHQKFHSFNSPASADVNHIRITGYYFYTIKNLFSSYFKPYNHPLSSISFGFMRISVAFVCLFACLFSTLSFALPTEEDQPEVAANSPAAPQDAESVVLKPKAEQLAGIKTQILQAVSQRPEIVAYGTVLSLEPLLQLRQQYLAAHAQQDSARAKYAEAHLNLSRTENLHQQDIVSTRRLQEQQVQWQADKANLEITDYQQQTILAASRQEWGETLSGWFIAVPQKPVEQFLQHGAQLLQITLPSGLSVNPDMRNIYVDEHGQRNHALKASLISASPKVDPVTLGERYFFKSEARHIPLGAHITAWISSQNQVAEGVVIPASAMVWHLGQSFVFVKTSASHYSRRFLPEYVVHKEGYFVSGYLRADEELVITGAQTLLSQQLKALIPNEDDD